MSKLGNNSGCTRGDLFWMLAASVAMGQGVVQRKVKPAPRVVFRNLGDGKFEELIEEDAPGIAAPHCSRGCAFEYFDNDGGR